MKHLIRQFIIIFILSALIALLRAAGGIYEVLVWTVIPLAGAVTAFFCVRQNVNPYLCWFLPPAAQTLAVLLVTMGYLPQGGQMVLTAFVSLVGSAAGDTANKQQRKKR